MVVEEHEIPNGWPLGLGTVNRLRVVESLPAAGVEPHSSHMRSASFSSLSSSNLDTEIKQSTASFFQDHSVTLGRLIGLRTGEKGGFYFQNSIGGFEEQDKIRKRDAKSKVSRGQTVDMSQGICIPLLLGALVKMSRSKSKARK